MNRIRIIMTSVGGLVVPSMIKSLRDYFEDIYIVGVDASNNAVGSYFSDKFYRIPFGDHPNYWKEVLEIALLEEIEFIIPLSDEETLALSKYKNKFMNKGIKILCSEYKKCKIAFNKGKMLDYLKTHGIDTPDFRIPKNCNELLKYAHELGYPEEKIVLKPNFSRGARGFWILDDKFDEVYGLINDRNRQTTTLQNVHNILANSLDFPSILLMEYLEGDDFNVDVLAKNGHCFYIIPNIRLEPEAGPVRVGFIKKDKKIYTLIKKIVKVFKFDYCLNIEVAYNIRRQKPMIYEINARVGAPIVANAAAGVNILSKSLELAMDKPIKGHLRVQETKMIRYWNELFISKDEYFKS